MVENLAEVGVKAKNVPLDFDTMIDYVFNLQPPKAGLMCSLLEVEAVKEVLGDVPVDVIFVLEGEEEIRGPSMPKFVEEKAIELRGSDLVYFAYPSEDVPGKPTIELGNKGIVFVELRARTSRYDVHSSFSPGLINPAVVLAKVASELIDPLVGPKLG